MQITKDLMVSFNYVLKDELGNEIDSSKKSGPLSYIHGYGSLIAGLERSMEGKSVGDIFDIEIQPEEAYGKYRQELIQSVEKSQFQTDEEIKEGMQFQAQTPSGNILLTVIKVEGEKITVDGNHPLAGQKLNFHIEIIECREPTREELDAIASNDDFESDSGCGGDCGCGGGGCIN